MKKLLTILILALTICFAQPTAVVKLYASISLPDYQHPWRSKEPFDISGSGVVLDNHTILTSAHMASNAMVIQVSKNNSTKKYIAKLKYISHQADLALLEVEDKSFFKGIKPLQFTTDITEGDSLTVLGYPKGGKSLSTTKGVISRIEFGKYVWSNEKMLSIQIDAAANSGNSGGAALNKDGKIVGIAMQILTRSNNIAYIVPSLIVDTFLEDIKDGKIDGYDNSLDSVEWLENQTLKEYYGIKGDKGIVVTGIDRNEKVLKSGDILLSINNYQIVNNATIKTRYGYQNYRYALHVKPVGDTVDMRVIRDKKIINIKYTLKRKTEVIKHEHNKKSRYLIYGGFVFAPITDNYLYQLKLPACMSLFFFKNPTTRYIKEAVAVQRDKFPLPINSGYYPSSEIVKSVNGTEVVDFAHFVKLIDNIKTPLTVIEFIDDGKKIVLDTKKARESFGKIKEVYELKSDRRL